MQPNLPLFALRDRLSLCMLADDVTVGTMTRFEGKVAAVTGGASGIGFSVAERLVADGATVAILDLTGADAAAKELGATGYAVDVSDAAQVESTLQSVVARHGGLHLLVNNAGIDGGTFPSPSTRPTSSTG